jgi:hypothetical protein
MIASAQSDSRLAVGLDVSTKASTGGLRGTTSVGPLFRVGHGSEGWQGTFGLNWYSEELDRPVGGQIVNLGELHIRPITGGYGYSRGFGRVLVVADVLAGFAFTSFSLTRDAANAYRAAFGAAPDTHISSAFVVTPETSAWIDLSPRFGLRLGVGYTIARPTLELSGPVNERIRLHADAFTVRVGAVYSIF